MPLDISASSKAGVPVVLPVANEDIAFTPTLNNITATYGTRVGMWSRSANRMRGSAKISFATVSAIGGIYTMTVPGGLNIDGQFIATSSEGVVGYLGLTDSSAGYLEYMGLVHMQGATLLQFKMHSQTSFNSSTVPVTLAAGDFLDINFDIPILEWRGASMLAYGAGLATSAKAGLVKGSASFSVYNSANQTNFVSGTTNKVAYNTVTFDSASAFNTTTNRFVAPMAGNYHFDCYMNNNNAAAMTSVDILLYKNGSLLKFLGGWAHSTPSTGVIATSGGTTVPAVAGDYFEIFATAGGTGNWNILGGAGTGSTFSGFLVP